MRLTISAPAQSDASLAQATPPATKEAPEEVSKPQSVPARIRVGSPSARRQLEPVGDRQRVLDVVGREFDDPDDQLHGLGQAPALEAVVLVGVARVIPKVLNIDPFHPSGLWADLCRQSGARRAAMRATSSDARRRWRQQTPGPEGGANRPAGGVAALARCPASRRACPAGRLATMKGVDIKDLWF